MAIAVAIDMRPKEVVELAETQKGFDYSQIDEGIRDEVKQAAHSIRAYGRAMQGSMINIGKRLIEIKGMLPHGQFSEWIAAEFDMSDRMARNFMNVAREYGSKTEIISVLSDTVLYMLAAPSTPEEARREVEQAAIEGKKVTVEFAKEAIRNAKPQLPKYAPIGQLEAIIHEWLEAQIDTDPDTILAEFEANINKPVNPWRRQVIEECIKRGVEFRPEDMAKAVGNVRHQRDIARKQADARVAYMKPNPKTEPKPDNMKIVDRDLDAYEAQTEREILEPSIHPRPVPDDLLDAGYLVLSDEDGLWRWQHMETGEVGDWWPWEQAVQDARQRIALTPTLPNPPADPRLAKATALRDLLLQAREAAKADYPDLTGRHTDLLPFERAVDALLPHLTRLIDLLEG